LVLTKSKGGVRRGTAVASFLLRIASGAILIVLAANHLQSHWLATATFGVAVVLSVAGIFYEEDGSDLQLLGLSADALFMLLACIALTVVGGKWWLGWTGLVMFIVSLVAFVLLSTYATGPAWEHEALTSAILMAVIGSFAWPVAVLLRGTEPPLLVVVMLPALAVGYVVAFCKRLLWNT
jgi:hypothetical protein